MISKQNNSQISPHWALEIRARLAAIFQAIFPSLEQADMETIENGAMDDLADWDSMGHLNLLISIEQEFGLQIGDEEALTLRTFPAVEGYLVDRLSA